MAYVVALKQWVADQLAAKAAAVHGHTLDETTDTTSRLALTPDERTKLTNTSGINTGDQTLPTWTTLADKPAVIAAGSTQAAARAMIGAGTSSLTLGTGSTTAAAGNHTHTGYAPALGADDNYVTDAEKAALHSHSNKTALDLVSGTNTGDQTLASLGAAPASGQSPVNTITAAASVTVPATHAMHKLTMTQNTTIAFAAPTAGHVFTLKLSGAFVPTWPASVTWAGGAAPAYASGKVYCFATFDSGTTWTGSAL